MTLTGGGGGEGSGGLESESRVPLGGLEGGDSGGAPGASRVALRGSSREVFAGDVDGAAAERGSSSRIMGWARSMTSVAGSAPTEEMVVSAGILLATVATLNLEPFRSPWLSSGCGLDANECRSCDVLVAIDLSGVYASGRRAVDNYEQCCTVRAVSTRTCSRHASPMTPSQNYTKNQYDYNRRDDDADNNSDAE